MIFWVFWKGRQFCISYSDDLKLKVLDFKVDVVAKNVKIEPTMSHTAKLAKLSKFNFPKLFLNC